LVDRAEGDKISWSISGCTGLFAVKGSHARFGLIKDDRKTGGRRMIKRDRELIWTRCAVVVLDTNFCCFRRGHSILSTVCSTDCSKTDADSGSRPRQDSGAYGSSAQAHVTNFQRRALCSDTLSQSSRVLYAFRYYWRRHSKLNGLPFRIGMWRSRLDLMRPQFGPSQHAGGVGEAGQVLDRVHEFD
jgi:hypothetical protein